MIEPSDRSGRSQMDFSAPRYEPQPNPRPTWQASLPPDQATPERWFEPLPPPPAPVAERPSRAGLFGILLAASVVGAVLGGGGTYALLHQTGTLSTPTATVAPSVPTVAVLPEYSAIIQAVARVSPSVVMIVTAETGGEGVGSGIVYDAAGWILTNKHVVLGAASIDVRLTDGRRFAAHLYGEDTLTDLAIIKIDGASGLSVAPLGDSSSLQVGQLAIAIGSPLGENYPNSVTSGIVSALGRDITVASDTGSTGTDLHGLIQTDAAINPGNSGGPLVDASGRVIGVTTALADQAQGIGFAIPIDIAKPIMQQALAGAPLSRPFMGITYIPLDKGVAVKNKLPLDHGAWIHREDSTGRSVAAVVADGPADVAGIKTGDIITALEGHTIDSTHLLEDILVQYAPGRTVSVELYRNGKYLTVRVTLGTRPTATN
jgi:serine protease Do